MPSTLTIGVQIHVNSAWLGNHLVDLADEALSAHEGRNYPAAVGRAGAFLEGLLARILSEWGTPDDAQPTLGPLIGAMRKSSHAPSALLERLNEANVIRNRGSHDNPPRLSQVTEGDSLQILNILALVVDWYSDQFHPDSKAGVNHEALPVFLSVGGPHRLDQAQFLQRLRAELRSLGVELRSLTAAEYHPGKPFDQIRDLLSSCAAALVVGLERYHAYALFEREKSDREKVHQDQRIPTSWNQIEASMASALGLPILVLRERRLHNEGVFEAENHGHQIRDFDLDAECRGLSDDLRGFLAGWVQHGRARLSSDRQEARPSRV